MKKVSSLKLGNIFLWNAAALLIFGLLCLLSASMIIAKTQFNDPYYYLKQQLLKGVLLGIIGFVVALFLSPKFYKKATPVLFIISLVLTILVFTPLGLELNGARRWIDVGFLTFQPNEIFKIAFLNIMKKLNHFFCNQVNSIFCYNPQINNNIDFISYF